MRFFVLLLAASRFSFALPANYFVLFAVRYTDSGEVDTFSSDSDTDCMADCTARTTSPVCGVATYNLQTSSCNIYPASEVDVGGAATVTIDTDVDAYVPKGQTVYMRGLYFPGISVGNLGYLGGANTKEDCAALCRQTTNCDAATFFANTCVGQQLSNGVNPLAASGSFLVFPGHAPQTTTTSTTTTTVSTTTSTTTSSKTSTTSSTSTSSTSSSSSTTTLTSTTSTTSTSTTSTSTTSQTSSTTSTTSQTTTTTTSQTSTTTTTQTSSTTSSSTTTQTTSTTTTSSTSSSTSTTSVTTSTTSTKSILSPSTSLSLSTTRIPTASTVSPSSATASLTTSSSQSSSGLPPLQSSSSSATPSTSSNVSTVATAKESPTVANSAPQTYGNCEILVASFSSVAYPFNCSSIDPNGFYPIAGLKNQRRRKDNRGGRVKRDTSKYVQFIQYQVQSVVLPRLGLSQQIPPALAGLKSLQILDLSGNQIIGSIPTVIGLLTNLQKINLAGNAITGGIPPQLGQLAKLQTLDISGNQLTGAIPPQLAQLTSIQTISLAGNELTGTIPPALLTAIAAKGVQVSLGTNCLAGVPNQRAVCNRKAPNCRTIALDGGYLDSRWTPLWNALAAAQYDMNAFDKAANELGAAYFGVREYEFQAFRYYAGQRAWCMAKHPEYVYLG